MFALFSRFENGLETANKNADRINPVLFARNAGREASLDMKIRIIHSDRIYVSGGIFISMGGRKERNDCVVKENKIVALFAGIYSGRI